ncbi:MAG: NAD(+) synthase [Lachnospiraceae bacterium]|nr:NAD(+) synthase [Lachnospiraceae bacterium]
MYDGFLKVASATPDIVVGDPLYNADSVIKEMDMACEAGCGVVVFPELCLTGYTCSDLFLQEALLDQAEEGLFAVAEHSRGQNMLTVAGLPILKDGLLYNAAAVIFEGEILGFVTKSNIPNYAEFYEARHFHKGPALSAVTVRGKEYPFGRNILFQCREMPEFVLGIEICEDLWVAGPPSVSHALAGATVIANLSASNESAGKSIYRHDLVKGQSGRLMCCYIYSDAGEGESTTDLVFSGDNMICENGSVLACADRFKNSIIMAGTDLKKLLAERRRISIWESAAEEDHLRVMFSMKLHETDLDRKFDPCPFVPDDPSDKAGRCEEILMMQKMGLKKRLVHTGCRNAVIGVSGGLDSTLALLVTAGAFDLAGIPRSGITAVTMPCFGTTGRTHGNAVLLAESLGTELKEVDIRESVMLHFRDIGQDPSVTDVTYENSQARERTQVLMDIANKTGGLVVGTGDLSELALGWATYNGDHMSMYGVNASVPKTLVRHLVRYIADTSEDASIKATLLDILDTPVSPELIPPVDGDISQKTEDIVGPYELHDFFLYHMLRTAAHPKKIFRMAKNAFGGIYSDEIILKWMKIFYRRFFSQQFKRSCVPDGPKVGSVALSPRGDLRMPSDASSAVWLRELEEICL